jgi:hypothetical protein
VTAEYFQLTFGSGAVINSGRSCFFNNTIVKHYGHSGTVCPEDRTVVANGRLFDRNQLDAMLADIQKSARQWAGTPTR